jgi:hypothetical protein
VPVPALRVAAAGYGAVLLLVGTREVHDLSWPVAVAVTAVPAWLVFGLAYRGLDAAVAVAGA